MIDWEVKIIEVCEQLDIDPEVYNNDDDAKELVAKLLGFPSFECFVALPEAESILDGRGETLLEGHKMQQLSLGEGCVDRIKAHYQMRQDEIDLEREVTRFIKYMDENFDDEFGVACMAYLFKEMKDVYDISEFSAVEENYKQWVKNIDKWL